MVGLILLAGFEVQAGHEQEAPRRGLKRKFGSSEEKVISFVVQAGKKDKRSDPKPEKKVNPLSAMKNNRCPVCWVAVSVSDEDRFSGECVHVAHNECKYNWNNFSKCSHCPFCDIKGKGESEIPEDQMHFLVELYAKGKAGSDRAQDIYTGLLEQLPRDVLFGMHETIKTTAEQQAIADNPKAWYVTKK